MTISPVWKYGRILWRNPRDREHLIRHWTDSRHPYVSASCSIAHWSRGCSLRGQKTTPVLERELIQLDTSLRAAMREIPPVFGHFGNV